MGDKRPHVVIVGAGFGGLSAAAALSRAPVRITLIDRTNHHLFQPLLYQVAMAGLSPADIAAPIRGVVSTQKNVSVLLAEVKAFDLPAKRVHTSAGDLDFDTLIVAAGAQNAYFGHDEWAPLAPGLKTLEDALEIRRRVLLAFERAEERRILKGADKTKGEDGHTARAPNVADRELTFVVIGGGPTGVELAGAISELSRFALARDFRGVDPSRTRVVLVEGGPRVLAAFPEPLSSKGRKQLEELGVEVRTDTHVASIDEGGVSLTEGGRIDAAVVLWGAGVRASPLAGLLAQAANATLDRQGRVPVGKDCSLVGHPEVFVVGDMAAFTGDDGKPLPGLSPVALQQGRYVARTIRARLDGKGPLPTFSYVDKGTMATIGRSRAVAWAGPIKVTGFLAWLMWLFVHLWFLVTFRNRVAVFLNWAWQYFTYKRGARLITEPAHEKTPPPPALAIPSDGVVAPGAIAPATPNTHMDTAHARG